MAPFKLKFRMGSSRSTSQEHDPDPQVNEALLNNHQHHGTAIGASSSTIDSTDCTSLGSMGTNERRSLLPNKSNNLRLGYIDPRVTICNDESSTDSNTFNTTPPSTYDHMLEELKLINGEGSSSNCRRDSLSNLNNSIHLSSLEHVSLNESITIQCTDPNCQENYICKEQMLQQQRQQNASLNECNSFNEFVDQNQTVNQNQQSNESNNSDEDTECEDDNRKESIDSTELLISNKMTASTTSAAEAASATQNNQNLMGNCPGDCDQCDSAHFNDECTDECNSSNNDQDNHGHISNHFFDPLINHSGYCSGDSHCNEENVESRMQKECNGGRYDSDSDDGWSTNQHVSNNQNHNQHQQQQQHTYEYNNHQQQQTYEYNNQQEEHTYEYNNSQQQQERALTPEVISNKSSKEIYKDLAKQWGITCKMSDTCRCMECQGHYFDCEYDDNEHQKTDGGLGAGTPMFISEVMHGSACNIL